MATFYQISEEEMRSFMDGVGFNEIDVVNCKEIVFQFSHPKKPQVGIRVYSSISKNAGEAREKGTDAIRCLYWSFKHERTIMKTPRIHRVQNWERNLLQRLRVMAGMVLRLPSCPICDEPMAQRTGTHGEFWGCMGYPKCRVTRSAASFERPLSAARESVMELVKKRVSKNG